MSIFEVLSQLAGGIHSGVGEQTGLWKMPLEGGMKTKSPAGGVASSSPTIWQNLGQMLGGYMGKQLPTLPTLPKKTQFKKSPQATIEELLERK